MEDKKLLEVALHSYAPHGLNFKCVDEDSGEFEILPLVKLNYECDCATIGNHEFYFDELPLFWLNPIECLTKPITVEGYNDGKEFVPMVELRRMYIGEQIGLNPATWSHRSIEMLNRWMIDYRGLIAKGLAVDKTSAL